MARGVEVDGEKIKRLREEARLSTSEAALLVGISSVGLWKIEKNGRTTLSTLRRLADALMCHPAQLMTSPEDYALLRAEPRDRVAMANARAKSGIRHEAGRVPAIR